MDVIGRGFLAMNLARIAGKHHDVVAFAAVTRKIVCPAAEAAPNARTVELARPT